LKNAIVIVTLSVWLSACAAGPQTSSVPRTDAGITTVVAASQGFAGPITVNQAGAASSEGQEEQLPSVELSEDLLFKLLRAELAVQRGDWQLAYVSMLVSAQQTRDPRLARRAAEIALNVKQTGEALAAIRLWRELAPNSEEATQYYLGFIMLSDNLAEAKPIFEQRLKEARPQARGLLMFQIQRLLTRAKDKPAAFSVLEELLAPYQSSFEARLALAQGAYAKGDAARARAEAQAALVIKPDSELAVLMLAQAAPDKEDALRTLASFVAEHPTARDVRIAYARMLIDEKQYDKARRELEILLQAQPKDLTILYALGVLGAQTNDLAAAEKHLTAYIDVLAANPDDERDPSQALLILSQIAEERKDTQAALKWLGEIDPGPAYFGAQLKRAQIVARSGDLNTAREMLRETPAEGEREQTQLIVADAQLLRDANQTQQALTVLADGLKRFPDDTGLLYDYAMAAEKAGQFDAMETALRKIMQLAPNNQHAYNALGYSLAERNIRLEEAFKLIEKALQLAPEDPFIMDSMGWVHFRLGRLKEAEDFLRRAYALRPDVEIGVHLGEVLWVKGQREDAQNLWRDANKKDPENDTLKSTLSRLHVNL
jgi:Flp pilus assembly protein TadD